MQNTSETARQAAAAKTAEFVESGMTLGFGSGRGVRAAIRAIAAHHGTTAEFKAIAGSDETANVAVECGMQMIDFTSEIEFDLLIDGADEIDPARNMNKGGGGCLVREKLLIAAAKDILITLERPKVVSHLCETHDLAMAVVAFGYEQTLNRILATGTMTELSVRLADDKPFITDDGDLILEGRLTADALLDLESASIELKLIPGVVDTGLFLGYQPRVLIGNSDGTVDVSE